MRKIVVAGNWKMNKNLAESIELISLIKSTVSEKSSNVDVIVCPPFTSLESASALVKDTEIGLGAQNMYFEENGAYTGEVSADMLKSVGCKYVILGHSERRTIFGETNEIINKKIKKAISAGLYPIFCIGETLEERESGKLKDVVSAQVKEGLEGVSTEDMEKVIIAYEPVWAIGTGKTATPEQAQEMHKFIRDLVADLYSQEVADNLVIQYGGSMKPDNAAELLGQPDIDGGLIGGAALKAESFAAIVKAG